MAMRPVTTSWAKMVEARMDKAGFEEYLRSRHLEQATIDDYCSYIVKFGDSFGMSADEIVQSDVRMAEILARLSELKGVSTNSYSSYATGLRAYYHFRNKKRYRAMRNQQAISEVSASVDAEEHWYKEVRVSDVDAWWQFIRGLNEQDHGNVGDPRCWAFRGQGDAAWGLESSLGRQAGYGERDRDEITNRLSLYERESMWTFGREASKRPEYRDLSKCNLLALMQHYGCTTRLLDFTMAPLVALYMALDQSDELYSRISGYLASHPDILQSEIERPELALWAIDLNVVAKKYNTERRVETVEEIAKEAERRFDEGSIPEKIGVIPLFPTSCNDRISAQDGLFLMPLSLRCSFEENLRAKIGCCTTYRASDLRMAKDEMSNGNRASIYKFVFDSSLEPAVRSLLLNANVTAKYVYPDLTGLGKFVSTEIRRHFVEDEWMEA